MTGPAAYERRLSFDPEQFGLPQLWSVGFRGLEYPGEVIVSESVDPVWGRELDEELHFRLVFFTVPRRIPQGQIQDPRVAMAVPRRSPQGLSPALASEIRSIHEARARYVTARDPSTSALRQSMEDRETTLRGEFARRSAQSFSQGRVYTHPSVRISRRPIFEEERPDSWTDRLASAVLSSVYPTVPYDPTSFPHTLTSANVAAVSSGLFHDDSEAGGAAGAFGPGLGLIWPELPSLFDASACQVVGIIQRELDERGGEVDAREILRVLNRVHGLVRPLALLYQLAFVRHTHAEIELVTGHGVARRDGSQFLADRISWDLVPELSFSAALAEQMGMLRPRPEATWEAVLPYATLLVEELRPSTSRRDAAEQERLLMAELVRMRARIGETREALGRLELALGPVPSDSREHLEAVEALCAVSGYREFHVTAQERFQGPAAMGVALDVYRRLAAMARLAPDVLAVKEYLDAMAFGRDHGDISLERDSLSARLDAGSLAASPALWDSVDEAYRSRSCRYARLYAAHHARYHEEALELGVRLERLRVQVAALDRFNEIPELGEPVGTDIHESFQRLTISLRSCTEAEGPELGDVPYCPGCELRLNEEIPRREVALVFGATEGAMREYNRRLGSHAVRRILAHPTKEQLDRFVNLVQIADLSALANVLDDEVVQFLRQFLKDSPDSGPAPEGR